MHSAPTPQKQPNNNVYRKIIDGKKCRPMLIRSQYITQAEASKTKENANCQNVEMRAIDIETILGVRSGILTILSIG